MIGIIGGSGLYRGIEGLNGEKHTIETPYGKVNVIRGDDFIFLSRHGYPPKPPHKINYHANIKAFEILGVEKIIAISSVGSLRKEISVGSIFMPTNLLDFTSQVWTYHDDEPYHVNMYEPFCKNLREEIHKILKIRVGGIYATMKGPQFETGAEANMLRFLGAAVVGMTVAPEAKLAKELNLCYQPLCVVVNYVDKNTTHQGTLEGMKKLENNIAKLVQQLIYKLS